MSPGRRNPRSVYEDKYFVVIAPERPLNCRDDGGHLILLKKSPVTDRSDLDWQEAIDFMRISMAVGRAVYDVLKVERMNYEDLGNWGLDDPAGPKMHLHFFGRAREQVHQVRDVFAGRVHLGVRHGQAQISSSARDSAIGLISATALARTASGAGQADSRAAISVARSKLSHSTTQ